MAASSARPKASSRQSERLPQLSCELCHERKIKCDKSSPCGNCRAAGVDCIPVRRKRLPRGRHVHNRSADSDLRDRVVRLETLISNMDPSAALSTPQSSAPASDLGDCSERLPHTPLAGSSRIASPLSPSRTRVVADQTGQGDYVAKHVWHDLVEEIHGLRGFVDQPSEDEDQAYGHYQDEQQQQQQQQLGHEGSSASIIGISSHDGRTKTFAAGSLAMHPMPVICNSLCQIYLRQVDPIIKILHRPSISGFIMNGTRYLGYADGHPSLDALRSAVFYAAVSSMTEDQCQSVFQAGKSLVTVDYRAACEWTLERADLITTTDITVLQAFILYLVATRSHDQSRVVWTLIPVAIRIARALSLHVDSQRPAESFFDKQMKKRLWYTICLLDLQASFDRASEPLISPDSPQPGMPRNINDSDFSPDGSTVEVKEREDLTDMTLSLLLFTAQESGKALNFIPPNEIGKARNFSWEIRQRCVDQFEWKANKFLRFCDPIASAYGWYTLKGSISLIASMKLSAFRPLSRTAGGATEAAPRVPNSSYLLELAVSVLEKEHTMRSDPRGQGFRWFEVPQWHPLAVAIAECYQCNDTELVRRVWPMIELSFEHDGNIIADYKKGMLWRPMEKLMNVTRSKVQGQLSSRSSTSMSVSSGTTPRSMSLQIDSPFPAPSGIGSTPPMQPMPSAPMSLRQLCPPDMSGTFDAAMMGMEDFNSKQWFPPTPFSQGSASQAGSGPDLMTDPAWGVWERFVNDLSFDEVASDAFQVQGYNTNNNNMEGMMRYNNS